MLIVGSCCLLIKGIYSSSTCTIDNSSFLNCSVTNSGSSYAYAYRGAIYGSSVLNIEGGDFVKCSSIKSSSGHWAAGGSIYADLLP